MMFLSQWIPPVACITATGGLIGLAAVMLVRWWKERNAPEHIPDWIDFNERINTLHRLSLQAARITARIQSFELSAGSDSFTLSWDSVSGKDGTESVSISGGGEVTREYLTALLDQTGEQIEDGILGVIAWYQTNVGPLPCPVDEIRDKPFLRVRDKNSDKICDKNDAEQEPEGEKAQDENPPPEKLWWLAWKRQGGDWQTEAYKTRGGAVKRDKELPEIYGDLQHKIYPFWATEDEIDWKCNEWDRIFCQVGQERNRPEEGDGNEE